MVILAAATLLLLGLWGTAERVASARDERTAQREAAAQTVTVDYGETLWQIAARHRPNVDPRITIQRIIRLNRLDDSTVQPGQQLNLPPR